MRTTLGWLQLLSSIFLLSQLLFTLLERGADSRVATSRGIGTLRSIPSFWPVSWIIVPAVAGNYRQPHPERTVFYRVFFHCFDKFLLEYENRFEREYGYFRPIIKDVVEKYLDCGNPKCGFARIRCGDCGEERPPPSQLVQQELLMAAEERGEYFWKHPWLLFVDLRGRVYPIADCIAVFLVCSLFLGNWPCL